MSQTIEALKKHSLKEYALDDAIANTYFSTKDHLKTIQQPKNNPQVRTLSLRLTAQIIGCIIVFSAVAILVQRAIVSIDEKQTAVLRKTLLTSPVIPVVENGLLNRAIIKHAAFNGSANNSHSKFTRDYIIMSNPRKYQWADLSLDFKFPVDLTNRGLRLSLRGKVGGEKINVVFRDAFKKSYRITGISLSSIWKEKTFTLDSIKGNIDLSHITLMRIESGYVGDSAKALDTPIDVTVYIRAVNAIKEN